MSDERKIAVLTPRARPQGAAHNLQAADRTAATPPPQNETAETSPQTPDAPVQAEPKRAPRKRTTKPASAPTATRVQLAADVTTDLRGRARAAFRHAAFHESVPTFSQFVANALEAEIKRIEKAYNDGEPLNPVTEELPRGRRAGG